MSSQGLSHEIDRGANRPYWYDRMADFGWARVALIVHRERQPLRMHDHPTACIHYFLSGHYIESFEDRIVIAGRGAVLVKTHDQPHANLMGADASLAVRIELRDTSMGPSVRARYSPVPSVEESCMMQRLAPDRDQILRIVTADPGTVPKLLKHSCRLVSIADVMALMTSMR